MEIKEYKTHHRNNTQKDQHATLFLLQWSEIMRAFLEFTSFIINERLRRSLSENRMIERDLLLYSYCLLAWNDYKNTLDEAVAPSVYLFTSPNTPNMHMVI
ncbi:hypothetical protein LI82_08765 [Methanococcoides methylutens]|uniref:Uncharacterized protein n=1 Tax=Methanococcoides methylutens TaxID=2226 RepID=A0A099T149_METMT|nr:hypothetical protein LI82_08765 [Methanococcoides methylutens]